MPIKYHKIYDLMSRLSFQISIDKKFPVAFIAKCVQKRRRPDPI